ncbi:hypothetical protein QY049_28440 [Bradyrhizobium sp. WYCCWR 13022]|uniref:hypothetical protein n=1 Tax=unclassified Bradyrhizobium TaxID=2631580 RepID=UPI00263A72E3|nr:hypothetical protein [Bradyrhizobium sp. WYCCWR 13022]MDN4987097.1 hypothetical protein [Bradyrhizobium sp. WYCCWR 13022]
MNIREGGGMKEQIEFRVPSVEFYVPRRRLRAKDMIAVTGAPPWRVRRARGLMEAAKAVCRKAAQANGGIVA